MKVIFIGNDTSIITGSNGDARARMKKLAGYFEKLTIIIFSLKEANLDIISDGNLQAIPTNSKTRWNFFSDAINILKKNKADLISTQDPFVAGFVGVIGKVFFNLKLNIQLHNDFFDNKYFRNENIQNFIFFWLGKFCLSFADTVRVVSQKLVKDSRYFVAPVAVDLDYFQSPRHTKIYNRVVTVSRLAKQKNLGLFFDLARQFPKTEFVIIGDGEQKDFLQKIRPDNVLMVGQKSRKEIKNMFLKSDIFVLTSNYEGWALVCIEALMAGLIVIMPEIGCANEAIINGMSVEDSQKFVRDNYSQDQLLSLFAQGLKKTK